MTMKRFAILPVAALLTAFFPTAGLPQNQVMRMPAPWGSVEGMSAGFLDFQEDSPLQVIGVELGNLDLLHSVMVVNISERTITKYQLGWVVTDRSAASPAGTPFLGSPCDTVLKPWETHECGRQGANFSTVLEDLKSRRIRVGRVTVGVVQVRFEDGSEWSYPFTERKQFVGVEPDPSYRLKLDPILKQLLEKEKLTSRDDANQPLSCAPRPRKGVLA